MINKNIRKLIGSTLAAFSLMGVLNLSQITDAAEKYVLKENATIFITASNAKKEALPAGTYPAGTYYIYKEFNGMINISRFPDKPGAWINPEVLKGNIESAKTEKNPSTSDIGDTCTVVKAIPKYVTASDAANKTNSAGLLNPGNYYLYKRSQGMINITLIPGIPGAWVNEKDIQPSAEEPKTPVSAETPKAPVNTVSSEKYEVKNAVAVYRNAEDAKNGVNSVKTYSKGTYYIFKSSNGMLNISKESRSAGGWINPQAKNTVVTPVKEVPKTETSNNGGIDLTGWEPMTFNLTFYSTLPEENGGYSITASGAPLKHGVVASNVYPFGTKIYLEGMGTYTVMDRGGKEFYSASRIDVLVERLPGESLAQYRQRIWNLGRKTVKGYIKRVK